MNDWDERGKRVLGLGVMLGLLLWPVVFVL